MQDNPVEGELNLTETDLGPTEEAHIETEMDLLTDHTQIIAKHILSDERLPLDEQQVEFIHFLRLTKTDEQKLALAQLYTDLELILILQQNIDYLDERDPLGQPTMENSAKKSLFLLDIVNRVISCILVVKPEVHYLRETYRIRRSSTVSVDEYNKVKSPELDLVKAFTNFEQLRLLLATSVQNKQAEDLLDAIDDRILPQLKEYFKSQRKRESEQVTEMLDFVNEVSSADTNRIQAEALLRQSIISLADSFLQLQSNQNQLPELAQDLSLSLKEVYRALADFRRTSAGHVIEEKAQLLTCLIEQSMLLLNRSQSLPTMRSSGNIQESFLLEAIEFLRLLTQTIDTYYESHPTARLDESYAKRLEVLKLGNEHLKKVIRQEKYKERPQLPFLNLKSFIYFAVKVIRELSYFNPQVKRKYRYYIERTVLDPRLQEAFRKVSFESKIERRYVIPTLLELNRLIRIVARISPNKDDLTAYQLTYYWFRLVEDNIRKLIAFLKTYPSEGKMSGRFDSIAFTLEMEAERVFGQRGHLSHLDEQSPLEEYIKRVEDSIGILGRVLQENYVYIAQTYIPNLKRTDLDQDYRRRLQDSMLVREHTWCVWKLCTLAEQELEQKLQTAQELDLRLFLNSLMRPLQAYLVKFLPKVFYSDRVEMKRTFNDLLHCATLIAERKRPITQQHLEQLRERIHVLATLFASLYENIKNRSVLQEQPFDEDTANRTLQKYRQLGII
ncbi:MAG: hypothetical protein RMM17_11545 [Acidobacteriota bacterium]|nr:hypothetical protein [Blastocatellia bacterium]MDW8413306.1 hypothetical protein [Acidobacteriota bacterium]